MCTCCILVFNCVDPDLASIIGVCVAGYWVCVPNVAFERFLTFDMSRRPQNTPSLCDPAAPFLCLLSIVVWRLAHMVSWWAADESSGPSSHDVSSSYARASCVASRMTPALGHARETAAAVHMLGLPPSKWSASGGLHGVWGPSRGVISLRSVHRGLVTFPRSVSICCHWVFWSFQPRRFQFAMASSVASRVTPSGCRCSGDSGCSAHVRPSSEWMERLGRNVAGGKMLSLSKYWAPHCCTQHETDNPAHLRLIISMAVVWFIWPIVSDPYPSSSYTHGAELTDRLTSTESVTHESWRRSSCEFAKEGTVLKVDRTRRVSEMSKRQALDRSISKTRGGHHSPDQKHISDAPKVDLYLGRAPFWKSDPRSVVKRKESVASLERFLPVDCPTLRASVFLYTRNTTSSGNLVFAAYLIPPAAGGLPKKRNAVDRSFVQVGFERSLLTRSAEPARFRLSIQYDCIATPRAGRQHERRKWASLLNKLVRQSCRFNKVPFRICSLSDQSESTGWLGWQTALELSFDRTGCASWLACAPHQRFRAERGRHRTCQVALSRDSNGSSRSSCP